MRRFGFGRPLLQFGDEDEELILSGDYLRGSRSGNRYPIHPSVRSRLQSQALANELDIYAEEGRQADARAHGSQSVWETDPELYRDLFPEEFGIQPRRRGPFHFSY